MKRIRRTKLEKQFDDALGALAAYNPNAAKDTPKPKKTKKTKKTK